MHVNYREIGRFPYNSGDFGRNPLHFCLFESFLLELWPNMPGYTGKPLLFSEKRSKKACPSGNYWGPSGPQDTGKSDDFPII